MRQKKKKNAPLWLFFPAFPFQVGFACRREAGHTLQGLLSFIRIFECEANQQQAGEGKSDQRRGLVSWRCDVGGVWTEIKDERDEGEGRKRQIIGKRNREDGDN